METDHGSDDEKKISQDADFQEVPKKAVKG